MTVLLARERGSQSPLVHQVRKNMHRTECGLALCHETDCCCFASCARVDRSVTCMVCIAEEDRR